MTENKRQDNSETDFTLGATESRLLQAMSLNDDMQLETEFNLQDFIAYAGNKLADTASKADLNDIINAIKEVHDPEIPINVYDMGLIYKIEQSEQGDVSIDMTLTAPTCPIAGVLPQQVADAVASLDGVGCVEVKLVWEPAWTPEKLTDEAKELLEIL